MFVDKVKIHVKAGRGGNGCVSFYRAKYVPNGGPDGGDGGKGGDVIFVTDPGLGTLMDFRYKKKFAASPGEDGQKQNRYGKSGADVLITVPVGTIIREAGSGKTIADLAGAGERRVLAKGGRGGRGNAHFATPSRQAPQYAEPGKNAPEYDLILELKLIADVGIIGLPNAGKSSLLAALTNASPKIANYPFTTLTPNLGIVRNPRGKDFIIADIPGLIEGAGEGRGLGNQFLRHVERSGLLILLADAASDEDPIPGIKKIENELASYNEALPSRVRIIAANKMDIPQAGARADAIERYANERNTRFIAISAAGRQGLSELLQAVCEILPEMPEPIIFPEDYVEHVDRDEQPFRVSRRADGSFVVEGSGIDKMLGYTHLNTEKGMAFFQKFIRDKGIIKELEALGMQEGDTVEVGGAAYTYYP